MTDSLLLVQESELQANHGSITHTWTCVRASLFARRTGCAARRVVAGVRRQIEKVEEAAVESSVDREVEKRERLFMEFNSLSVVYGRPSENFLKD